MSHVSIKFLGRQNVLHGPITPQSVLYCRFMNTKFFSPCRDSHCFSLKSQPGAHVSNSVFASFALPSECCQEHTGHSGQDNDPANVLGSDGDRYQPEMSQNFSNAHRR